MRSTAQIDFGASCCNCIGESYHNCIGESYHNCIGESYHNCIGESYHNCKTARAARTDASLNEMCANNDLTN